jgi:hypothetical protein
MSMHRSATPMIKKLLAFTCLTLSIGANAAYLVTSSPGVATGIGALNIGGTFYNVDFEAEPGGFNTFGGLEEFWGDVGSSTAASNAIGDFLFSQGIAMINNASVPWLGVESFTVWHNTDDGVMKWYEPSTGMYYDPFDGRGIVAGMGSPYSDTPGNATGTAWSVAAVVPLPAAAWLFGSALLGLGALKRKKA